MTGFALHDRSEPVQAATPTPPGAEAGPAPATAASAARVRQVAATVLLAGVLAACAALALHLPATPAGAPWYDAPAMFPLLAMALGAAGALAQLLLRRRPPAAADAALAADEVPDDEIDATDSAPHRAGLGTLLLLLYPAAITAAGFAPATLAFVLAGARLCGLPWRRALLIGGVLAAVLHGVFVGLFHVGLPTPLILDWLGR